MTTTKGSSESKQAMLTSGEYKTRMQNEIRDSLHRRVPRFIESGSDPKQYIFRSFHRDHPFKTSAICRGGGVKNLPNLLMDSSKKKTPTGGRGQKS